MKRLILTLAAAASVLSPLALATTADAQSRYYGGNYYGGNDNRYRGDDRRDNDRRDNDRRDNDRRDNDRRWDDRRDNDRRWDNNRYNGYYLNNRWYWGEPSVNFYYRNDYRPGYRPWQRGGYLPRGYPVYVVNDWQRYRLRPPPRGYHWVYANNNYVLAAIATGLILEVLASR